MTGRTARISALKINVFLVRERFVVCFYANKKSGTARFLCLRLFAKEMKAFIVFIL